MASKEFKPPTESSKGIGKLSQKGKQKPNSREEIPKGERTMGQITPGYSIHPSLP